ncbi:F-box only protein 33 [Rhopalosiphum maidis]|uniref:F-box only protein 33 n=1 Tax=Rhopalosiphum maidis TaxID=43146 RepID=UPI000EFF9DB5|nr:F-box only protein 33 [Rhopalosiphum maidis]XP_026805464.1 F-box only protein 33 [Rhopalosiphum maidis]XP_060852012.1 F-box only protein 33 [Rhopalosiphum padi]
MGTVDWNSLPSLALHQVFTHLSPESRVAASSTCKHWRTALYHPQFWHSLVLDISSAGTSYAEVKSKVKHANKNLVTLVRDIHLAFDSRSTQCFELASSVIKALMGNELLRNVDIELNHCELSKDEIFQYRWSIQNYFEFAILNVVQKGNIEGFSFGYFMFYYWNALIHMLSKYSCDSLQRLELAGLGPSIFNEESKTTCFNSTFDSMSSLINLKKLSLDLNSNTCKLLPALCSMSQLEILVLHVHNELDIDISDDIWADIKKYCPKLELRLTIINCHIVAKHLHTKLLRPSMPLTHLKVLFCNVINVEVLHRLVDYRNTFQSLIWVDEQSMNPAGLLKGHWHLEPSPDDIETNPLIILSWVCSKITELVVLGYFIEPVDVCGIARLRGSNLKRYELLEEDICFQQPQSEMIYDEVVLDVSNWMETNWKPLNKNNLFVSHSHYILQCISKDLTTKLDIN